MDAQHRIVFLRLFSEHQSNIKRIQINYISTVSDQEQRMRLLVSALEAPYRNPVLKTGKEWGLLLKMDEHTFQRHVRVTWAQFNFLMMKFEQQGLNHVNHVGGRPDVPLNKKVLMMLWYMANQNSFREIADRFDVCQSTAHRSILELLGKLCSLTSSFIAWPTQCEKRASAASFARACTINNIIGAIDGCHIKIQRPVVRGGDYLNRKGFYSVILQGIVDERGRFLDIFVGAPGKVHDARVLRSSTFYSTWEENMGEFKLLGDSAYIGNTFLPFIVTPKRDNGALTAEDLAGNLKISRGRVIVEQAFGRVKCRWRRIRDLQNTRLDIIVMVIMSACILHNLCAGSTDICEDHPQGCPRQADDDEQPPV